MKKYLVILFFFLLNCFWVIQDNTLPAIGDDARWLSETANLTHIVQSGDSQAIFDKWQNMFIKDTNSFPRTPLFTALSVPSFLIFGVNENVAIITNVFVLAITSLLLAFFVEELFKNNSNKSKISLFSILIFNLMAGTYGLSRLYMSEILQTAFVILISFVYLKNKENFSYKSYLLLGFLWGLAFLLRFLMPMYLIVPSIFFLKWQLNQKKKFYEYALAIIVFAIPFLLTTLTWYGQNLTTYIEFTKYTSSGELAEITSLGPVYSPITWFKYWKVIGLWHFGLPILLMGGVSLIINYFKTSKIKLLFAFKELNFLILSFLPAFILTTLSVNKTARYFYPVEFFIVVIIAYLVFQVWANKSKVFKLFVLFLFALSFYPFIDSIIKVLPNIPYTNFMYSSAEYQSLDVDEQKYSFIIEELKKYPYQEKDEVYLVAETPELNDAQILWYASLKGEEIKTIGEFSLYTTLDEGKAKIDKADIVILHVGLSFDEKYLQKYLDALEYIKSNTAFELVSNKEYTDSSSILIFKRK